MEENDSHSEILNWLRENSLLIGIGTVIGLLSSTSLSPVLFLVAALLAWAWYRGWRLTLTPPENDHET